MRKEYLYGHNDNDNILPAYYLNFVYLVQDTILFHVTSNFLCQEYLN